MESPEAYEIVAELLLDTLKSFMVSLPLINSFMRPEGIIPPHAMQIPIILSDNASAFNYRCFQQKVTHLV